MKLMIVYRQDTHKRLVYYNDKTPLENLKNAIMSDMGLTSRKQSLKIDREIREDRYAYRWRRKGVKGSYVVVKDVDEWANYYITRKIDITSAVERRNQRNIWKCKEKGLSNEVTILLIELCKTRHSFHSNLHCCYKSDRDFSACGQLYTLNDVLIMLGFRGIDFSIPYDEIGFIDVLMENNSRHMYSEDDIRYLPVDYTEAEYSRWYERNFERTHDQLSQVNADIEKYLKSLDEEYGTDFCPSGSLRNW